MKHGLVFCCLMLVHLSSESFAEEYLIHVDAVGYEDAIVGEKVPAETVLRSIEVFAQPNKPFRSKVRMGAETLTLEGTLTPEDDGSFSMNIKYLHEVDTGDTVPTVDGGDERIMDITSFACTVTITLDKPVMTGGMETKRDETLPGGKESHTESKLWHYLTVTRQNPTRE